MDAPAVLTALVGPRRITLVPAAVTVDAGPGQSVLDAVRAAGWHLPVSCRNGTCRTCRARCLSGQVHYRVEWPGLLAEEKAEGWILPCVAEPLTDLVIEAPATRTARTDSRPA